MAVKILDSAKKHGIHEKDIIYVIEHAIEVIEIAENPQKLLYIGFDRSLRTLEVITVLKSNGEEIVIHAMKATKKVIKILKELQNA
ncbi:toxin [Candidatus Termititenax persephonae]|uniref:Toxin n=1 Tax=Candidatus Termititenax persephonae TaxID=2218525 RepID=A0A388TEW4_9BACT|nr:toxin [Candidatus Termititenax persephonae]